MIPDPGEERLLVSISALAVVHLKSGHNLKVSSFFFFFLIFIYLVATGLHCSMWDLVS